MGQCRSKSKQHNTSVSHYFAYFLTEGGGGGGARGQTYDSIQLYYILVGFLSVFVVLACKGSLGVMVNVCLCDVA